MYFITMGGKYYYCKESQLPQLGSSGKSADGSDIGALVTGKPLPHGFKRGDAAVLMDTLHVCKDQMTPSGKKRAEQQILVVEFTEKGSNLIIAWDLRQQDHWSEPKSYSEDKAIGRAQVDSAVKIDAMFSYRENLIYVIQNSNFAGVNFLGYCDPDEGFGEATGRWSTAIGFATDQPIFAMTTIESSKLLMFHEDKYYVLLLSYEDNKLSGIKDGQDKTIVSEFFKFDKTCNVTAGAPPAAPPGTEGATVGTTNPNPPTSEPEATEGGGGGGSAVAPETTTAGGDGGGGGATLIIIIIIIIIVLLIIALIAFLLMRKKKSDDGAGAEEGKAGGTDASGAAPADAAAGGAAVGAAATKSSIDGKAEGGSKVSPSKAGSKVGGSSTGGASPSKMSVRSVASGTGGKSGIGSKAIPSGVGSKAPPSAVKSSMSKK